MIFLLHNSQCHAFSIEQKSIWCCRLTMSLWGNARIKIISTKKELIGIGTELHNGSWLVMGQTMKMVQAGSMTWASLIRTLTTEHTMWRLGSISWREKKGICQVLFRNTVFLVLISLRAYREERSAPNHSWMATVKTTTNIKGKLMSPGLTIPILWLH